MRVDTTVVETSIHYPTDSSLLGDGVRVLTRVMKRITGRVAGKAGAKSRDRSRSWRAAAGRWTSRGRRAPKANAEARRNSSGPTADLLLSATSRVVGAGKALRHVRVADGTKRANRRSATTGAGGPAPLSLMTMLPRVRQVMSRDQSAHLPRRHAQRWQAREPVRASNGDHPQGQGRQADRIRQDGQAAGGGKPDRHRLRGL